MSLRAFEPQLQIEPLAIELEARIKDVMPLLPVPLLAKVILSVEGPNITGEACQGFKGNAAA